MSSAEPDGADADLVVGLKPASARDPLTRERIVATAVGFIDEHGLLGLTMRRLGEELGVEAMALYRYVPGKEDLLDAVVESLIAEMETDPEVRLGPCDGWQDFLQRLAHGVRRVALRHPLAFPLVAARLPEARWLRPPLRSLTWVEAFLQAMTSEGFSPAAAVQAYRGFTSFLLGHLLLEVAFLGADMGPLSVLQDGSASVGPLKSFPMVALLRDPLSENHSATEFEESLENLIDRMSVRFDEDNE